MTTLEKMLTEQTSWELNCPNENYVIVISDVTIHKLGGRRVADQIDLRQILGVGSKTDLIYTHIILTSSAVKSLLSGKDEFFKLEKIAILNNNKIKFYFNRLGDIKYSCLEIDIQRRPCFTATLMDKSGDIIQKSHIAVDVDYCIHAETIW